MAKALFHKNQRVFVKPVGTWAIVEKVIPQWVKGMDEPLRVHYDVGLGRVFLPTELTAEDLDNQTDTGLDVHIENWRVLRLKNKWQAGEEVLSHPFPGTFPVVVTDENDWGGWRVPGAEYERDPHKIEFQARMMTCAPDFMKLSKSLVDFVMEYPEDTPDSLQSIAKQAVLALRRVYDIPDSLPNTPHEDPEEPSHNSSPNISG